jgi:hypothetical protein
VARRGCAVLNTVPRLLVHQGTDAASISLTATSLLHQRTVIRSQRLYLTYPVVPVFFGANHTQNIHANKSSSSQRSGGGDTERSSLVRRPKWAVPRRTGLGRRRRPIKLLFYFQQSRRQKMMRLARGTACSGPVSIWHHKVLWTAGVGPQVSQPTSHKNADVHKTSEQKFLVDVECARNRTCGDETTRFRAKVLVNFYGNSYFGDDWTS